jgi:hypothetical protein
MCVNLSAKKRSVLMEPLMAGFIHICRLVLVEELRISGTEFE